MTVSGQVANYQMKKFYKIIFTLIPLIFISSIIVGEEFTEKKSYRDWSVFVSNRGSCFLASNAKTTKSIVNSTEIVGRNRTNAFLYFLYDKSMNNYSISYFSDFPLQKNENGIIQIDSKKEIPLKVQTTENKVNFKNAGVLSISNNDVNLLIAGTKITAVFTAVDGSTLIDKFSLIGFTKSLKYLSKNCI